MCRSTPPPVYIESAPPPPDTTINLDYAMILGLLVMLTWPTWPPPPPPLHLQITPRLIHWMVPNASHHPTRDPIRYTLGIICWPHQRLVLSQGRDKLISRCFYCTPMSMCSLTGSLTTGARSLCEIHMVNLDELIMTCSVLGFSTLHVLLFVYYKQVRFTMQHRNYTA